MTPDDLASSLLEVLLRSSPLTGSLLGLSEYDGSLPDFSAEAQEAEVGDLEDVAGQAALLDASGIGEIPATSPASAC